jgi:hypothetical protein
MIDPFDIIVDLGPPTDGLDGWNDFILRVPLELRRRLSRILVGLLAQHPPERVRDLIHGKTVAELTNYTNQPPIASGETEGKKWALYDPPADPAG